MPARLASSNTRFSQPVPDDMGSSLLLQDSRKVPHRRSRELLGLAILALGIFIAMGLVTFRRDPLDPTVAGSNWVGPVGDCASGWLIQGFGVVALLLPVELLLMGVSLLRSREVTGVGFRLASDLILGILLSSIVQVLFPDATAFAAMHASGNVGLLFGELSRGLFSGIGTVLVATTIAGLLLIGRSPYPFVEACERAAALVRRLLTFSFLLLRRAYDAWTKAKSLRRVQLAAAGAESLPHIDSKPSDDAIIAEITDEDCDEEQSDEAGTPKLALSQNLRNSLSSMTESLLDTVTPAAAAVKSSAGSPPKVEPPPAEEPAEDEPELELEVMPLRSVPKVSRAQRVAPPQEPRIVDTRPAQRVTRAEVAAPPPRRVGSFRLPSTELLSASQETAKKIDEKRILEHARRLEKTLADYGVSAKVEEIHPGPTVTTYEVSAQAGTKVSKVAGLADDLALGLSRKVRIIAPIPGKSRIGFELPNDERIAVNLRELVEDQRFVALSERAPLPVVLGRDIVGAPFYADLASFPHIIVAGATGAGKSVGLNVMLASLLFRRSPDELRLLMIDPKVVELAPYDGIPHLLIAGRDRHEAGRGGTALGRR